jgi:hypothetical protein
VPGAIRRCLPGVHQTGSSIRDVLIAAGRPRGVLEHGPGFSFTAWQTGYMTQLDCTSVCCVAVIALGAGRFPWWPAPQPL